MTCVLFWKLNKPFTLRTALMVVTDSLASLLFLRFVTKIQPHGGAGGKTIMNVCGKFLGNLFNSWRDISYCTKVVTLETLASSEPYRTWTKHGKLTLVLKELSYLMYSFSISFSIWHTHFLPPCQMFQRRELPVPQTAGGLPGGSPAWCPSDLSVWGRSSLGSACPWIRRPPWCTPFPRAPDCLFPVSRRQHSSTGDGGWR